MRLNLLLLMATSFLPFPTRLVAEAVRDEDAERAAVVFYGLALLAIAICIALLWRAVLRDRELLRPGVGDAEVAAITRAATPSLAFYVAAIAIGIVAPRIAALGYLLIALVGVARARGDSVVPADPGGEPA
jgi:TMEM175 potassium channel family protein